MRGQSRNGSAGGLATTVKAMPTLHAADEIQRVLHVASETH
jgi:hypothetical protein